MQAAQLAARAGKEARNDNIDETTRIGEAALTLLEIADRLEHTDMLRSEAPWYQLVLLSRDDVAEIESILAGLAAKSSCDTREHRLLAAVREALR